jgi:transposase-like protein
MANRKFSAQFKLQIVREVEDGQKRISQICREYSLSDSLVRRWAEQYRERGADAFRGDDPRAEELEVARRRIAELESALGRTTLELDFLRRCVKRANIPLPDGARW